MKNLLQPIKNTIAGLSLAATFLLLSTGQASAAEATYVGPDNGFWTTPGNWSTGSVPTSIDDVTITNSLTVVVPNTIDVIYIKSLTITATTFGNQVSGLDLNGKELNIYGALTLNGGTGNSPKEVRILLGTNGLIFYSSTFTQGGKVTIDLPNSIVHNPALNPLPVELVSFKAVKKNAEVALTWETASEKNNTGFEVQSSTDGKNYERIGFVASANGTSSSLQRYAFTDKASNKEGLAYYRLKQIDLDGTFEFFAAKVVDLGRTGSAVSAYPNPFQNQFAVNLTSTVAEAAVITVTDMTGKTVYATTAQLQKGSNTLNVTLKDQPAGIYMLNATAGNQTYINRLVKQ